jgi:hypothetical protein
MTPNQILFVVGTGSASHQRTLVLTTRLSTSDGVICRIPYDTNINVEGSTLACLAFFAYVISLGKINVVSCFASTIGYPNLGFLLPFSVLLPPLLTSNACLFISSIARIQEAVHLSL